MMDEDAMRSVSCRERGQDAGRASPPWPPSVRSACLGHPFERREPQIVAPVHQAFVGFPKMRSVLPLANILRTSHSDVGSPSRSACVLLDTPGYDCSIASPSDLGDRMRPNATDAFEASLARLIGIGLSWLDGR